MAQAARRSSSDDPAPSRREHPSRSEAEIEAARQARVRARRRRRGPSPTVYRRRRLAALGGVVGFVVIVVAAVSAIGGGGSDAKKPAAPKLAVLPGGGRQIFPDRRIVAYYGNPRADSLGVLGIGSPSHAVAKLKTAAAAYSRKTRPVLPTLELITTIADSAPGPSGKYRTHASAAIIDRYLAAARRSKSLLLLDVQPGYTDFVTEAKRLEPWLRQPDVGLALDPEWHLKPGQIPGQIIGSVGSPEVDRVSSWLSRLTTRLRLPQKLFVIHRFTPGMIKGPPLVMHRNLATVENVDGVGDQVVKVAKYKQFSQTVAPGAHNGFKLFYDEDKGLMSPRSVMALQPRPDMIVYE